MHKFTVMDPIKFSIPIYYREKIYSRVGIICKLREVIKFSVISRTISMDYRRIDINIHQSLIGQSKTIIASSLNSNYGPLLQMKMK